MLDVPTEIATIIKLSYRRRNSEDAWVYLQRAAERLGEPPDELWQRVAVTELTAPVLAER